MNRQIQRLRRDIEKGASKECQPHDRYAYNVFAWSARYWMVHGPTERDRREAERFLPLLSRSRMRCW
jgi:hypothetical protein